MLQHTDPHERQSQIYVSCTGPLPKVMPPSLEELILDGGYGKERHKFMGGIPSEWGSLTNLKKLSMERCGLDGASRAAALPSIPPPTELITNSPIAYRAVAEGDAAFARGALS